MFWASGPTRAETGYGYIEAGGVFSGDTLRVRRFTEKPDADNAAAFVAAGNYYWNSGMFLWSARTLANALREHLPKTAPLLEEIAAAFRHAQIQQQRFADYIRGLREHQRRLCRAWNRVQQRAKRAGNIFCLPLPIFGWNDLGSWTALHEHHTAKSNPVEGNLIHGAGVFALNAHGNYVHAPGKFVAVVGVEDLVVVETDDALLITTRQHAQDVGKVVKYLDEKKLHKLV